MLFSVVFAFMYKFLPDVIIHWRDVWIGGVATAIFFAAGKFLLSVYLGSSSTASAYGAFGSLVVVLVWVYYSSQIVFFGAELTQVLARRHGSGLAPEEGARCLKQAGGMGKERGERLSREASDGGGQGRQPAEARDVPQHKGPA